MSRSTRWAAVAVVVGSGIGLLAVIHLVPRDIALVVIPIVQVGDLLVRVVIPSAWQEVADRRARSAAMRRWRATHGPVPGFRLSPPA